MEVLFKKPFTLEDFFMADVCLVLGKTLDNTFFYLIKFIIITCLCFL